MSDHLSIGATPAPSRISFQQKQRCASRPRLPDCLKPTPTLQPYSIVSLTTPRVAALLSPSALADRQRLDELQSNLRTHSEHKKKVFNYLVTVKAKRQEEEGGELGILEGDVAENRLAGHMLDVLDTIDEMLLGVDQRLMDSQIKGEVHIKEHEPDVPVKTNFKFKLPAWNSMMDEDTPPGSPFSRSLFVDAVEGEPIMELAFDEHVKDEEAVKANAELETFEPPVKNAEAIRVMFESFLGPRMSVVNMAAGGEENAEVNPDKECSAIAPQALILPARIERMKQTTKEPREVKAAITDQAAQRSVTVLRKSIPPMKTLAEEESDYSLDDYYDNYMSDGFKDTCDKPTPLPLTMCSDPPLQRVKSLAGLVNNFDSTGEHKEHDTSTNSIKTVDSSGASRKNSDAAPEADSSASTVPEVESQHKPAHAVATMFSSFEVKVTGGANAPYKPGGRIADLLAMRKAGVKFNKTDTLEQILAKKVPEGGAVPKRKSTESTQSDEYTDTSMDSVEIQLDVVPQYSQRLKDPFLTPKRNPAVNDDDDASVYSRPSGFSNTQKPNRQGPLDTDIATGSPQGLKRTQQIKRGCNSPGNRNPAGPAASQKAVPSSSPASTGSQCRHSPKEIRMLGLTMEQIFLDPHTGEFIKPDKSLGGVAELRRKYAGEGRAMYDNGQLSMETLQNAMKEQERERSMQSLINKPNSAKRMPPPGQPVLKISKGNSKRRFGMHRQQSTPTSIAATLFSRSRKISEPPSFKASSRRTRTPSIDGDEKIESASKASRQSGIGAGMRRIFGGSFGRKDSIVSNASKDNVGLGLGNRFSIESGLATTSTYNSLQNRTHSNSVTSTNSFQTVSAASQASSSYKSYESQLQLLPPLFPRATPAQVAHDSDGNMMVTSKAEPRKLPSPPPPKLARHATVPGAGYGNLTSNRAPTATAIEGTEWKVTTIDHGFRGSLSAEQSVHSDHSDHSDHSPTSPMVNHEDSSPGGVPEISLSPPIIASANPIRYGFNTQTSHSPTRGSRLPTPTVALKRPQTGAGSRPVSRANSRGRIASRPGSKLGQRTTSRNSLGGRSISRASLGGGGGRRSSVSSALSRSNSRAAISRPGTATGARPGGISRQRGVANLRMLENRGQKAPPATGVARPSGAGEYGRAGATSVATVRAGGVEAGARSGYGIASTSGMAPPPKMGALRPPSRPAGTTSSMSIRSGSSSALSSATARPGTTGPDGYRTRTMTSTSSRLPNYAHSPSRSEQTLSRASHRTRDQDESPGVDTQGLAREWLARDIPVGTRIPAPHLMSSPGGRYPKPIAAAGAARGRRGVGQGLYPVSPVMYGGVGRGGKKNGNEA